MAAVAMLQLLLQLHHVAAMQAAQDCWTTSKVVFHLSVAVADVMHQHLLQHLQLL